LMAFADLNQEGRPFQAKMKKSRLLPNSPQVVFYGHGGRLGKN
jgi:hypothetical protein